ncbi:diacylglycerol/lipid kinase family protein [Chloroflexota bacterium]
MTLPSYTRLIVNPAAGAGKTAKKWPLIMRLLKSIGLRFEHDVTEAPGHAIELAKAAARKGYELIVSVGGDGTVNEVVNGLYQASDLSHVQLGIISTGTGSDYIRTLGIPRHYEAACHRLMNPKKLVVDLGMAEYTSNGTAAKRIFVNFAGLGFAAGVVKATTKRFKTLGDVSSYLLGLLVTLVSYRNKEICIKLDGKQEERKVCAIMVSNGRYGGGSMLVAPLADPMDGWLDVLIIDNLSKPDLLWSLPRVYRGTHLTHPKVTTIRAKEIEVSSSKQISLQADGELLGEVPASFRVLPSVLNVLV